MATMPIWHWDTAMARTTSVFNTKITPRINGWEVEHRGEKFVFTEFKELTKFLRTRCKPIEEATDDE